jgi:2-polyprenyl-3-methyl-5-hydroxy-6-metoxy-1,4-benzoquinol methylase
MSKLSYGKVEMNKAKELSPERLYIKEPFDFTNDNVVKHISRYFFAQNFAYGQILDCSCGSGYGSKILGYSGSVTGIDISHDAITYAKAFNSEEDIKFVEQDIKTIDTSLRYDSIVCIETFEHLKKSDSIDMLIDFNVMLKEDGILFLTTPMLRLKDNKPYVTNPYHVNELPKKELLSIFSNILKGYSISYFHQDINRFYPLVDESTGFMVIVARKRS